MCTCPLQVPFLWRTQNTHNSSLLQLEGTTNLFSVSVDLPILGSSYKWNHTTCGFCGLFHLAQGFQGLYMLQQVPVVLIPSCCQVTVHAWIYHTLFIHSSTDRHLGCFHFWDIMDNVSMTFVYKFYVDTFHFFWVYI